MYTQHEFIINTLILLSCNFINDPKTDLLNYIRFLCLDGDWNHQKFQPWFPINTLYFFCCIQETCSDDSFFLKQPSSFDLKQPAISLFAVSSHKNIHTVTSAHLQEAKSTRHKCGFYWLIYVYIFIFIYFCFNHKPFRSQYIKSEFRKSLSLISCVYFFLQIISNEKRDHQKLKNMNESLKSKNQWKTLNIQPLWSHHHTMNCYLCKLGKII